MVDAPKAEKIPHQLTTHGEIRNDPYFWLNNREDPKVIKYLEDENAYTEAVMSSTEPLQKKLFEEMKGRIKKDDSSAPYYYRGSFYYTRTEGNQDYPIYCRKKGSLDAKEEIILDVNELAKGHNYFNVGGVRISPDGQTLAYAEDTAGRRIYTIKFRDISSQKTLPVAIPEVTGNLTWANDNKTIFYTKQDPVTLRSHEIYRFNLDEPEKSKLVYTETDETFSVYVSKTKTDRFIMATSHSTLSSDVRYLSADQPTEDWQLFQERLPKSEYFVEDGIDRFYIYTNDNATNFKVMQTDINKTERKHWETVVEHNPDVYLEDLEVFKNFLVLSEKEAGLNRFRIIDREKDNSHYIQFDETTYLADPYINKVYDTDTFLYSYESLTTPDSVYAYHITHKKSSLIKQEEILGGFDAEHYESKRVFAEAQDGTKIPMSLVYRKGLKLNGKNPTLIYGYGSYGITVDPSFSPHRLSLLDRGFVFAIAHIRGGAMLGRQWYEDGKLLNKKNTFADFIACSEYLIDQKYTNRQHLYAMGGSAGGMLMGAIVNMRPELYNGVIAAVPFVDIVTTMLDDSIPLTTSEYDEWGNPNDKKFYEYMLSYSPYDNVRKQDYPNILITTGLHDSQVQYWEPAKWVAKLRDMKTDSNLLLLKTNMDAGHSGASGRFTHLKEIALDYAFLLKLEGQASS
jgi:oligopeptidase B